MCPQYEIVKDAIHGYIKIFEHERKLVDTPVFQRLRRISQNPCVHFVYPGATHTRFSHSLGVMHVAGAFTERLLEQVSNTSSEEKRRYYYLMRLWGLLHDIGHGPFSHLFDDVILKERGLDHEIIGAKILRESGLPPELKPENNMAIKLDDIAKLFEVKALDEWPFNQQIGESPVNETIFYYICRGAYSADIIDYLLRDSYFTGAGYGSIDWERLIQASEPSKDRILLDPRAEEAFDSLLLARLFMFYTVYYHRTTRAAIKVASYFLREAANKLNNFDGFLKDMKEYATLDDYFLLFHPELKDCKYGRWLIERKIPYSKTPDDLRVSVDPKISEYLDEKIATQKTRQKLSSSLKDKLPEEAFFVDTPKFVLHPVFGEEEKMIYLKDPSKRDGYRPRNTWETSWATLKQEIMLLRLFIHDDYREHEKEIREAFKKGHPETHY